MTGQITGMHGVCASTKVIPGVVVIIQLLDVEIHHLETPHPLKFTNVKVSENGPVRASVVAEVKYGKSTIKTTVCCFQRISWSIPHLYIYRSRWMRLQVRRQELVITVAV